MNWIDGLSRWRDDRDIEVSSGMFEEMVSEEIEEYACAVFIHDKVDAIADIIVLSANELALEGYDINLVMDEVVKEISSRKQCPKQASMDWKGKQKWKKDPNQKVDTLYKADYHKCKLRD